MLKYDQPNYICTAQKMACIRITENETACLPGKALAWKLKQTEAVNFKVFRFCDENMASTGLGSRISCNVTLCLSRVPSVLKSVASLFCTLALFG